MACTTALVAGCSVINSFDEVGTIDEGGGTAGSGAEAGSDSGGSTGATAGAPTEAGQGGTTTPSEGGSGGVDSPPVEGGAGGEPPVQVAPPGLIVVSGSDDSDASVVSVLSPQTGEELRRDELAVPMFAHDGIRDSWYVASVVNGVVLLDMRRYDRVTDEWEVAGDAIEIPPPADNSANGWVALRERFAYLSNTGNDLVVIDSSDPAALEIQTTVVLSAKANGLVGWFGNNPGGTVNIVRTTTGCVLNMFCEVTFGRIQVKATGSLTEEAATPVATIPHPNGKGTWGANTQDDTDVVITPNNAGTEGVLAQLNPNTHSPVAGESRTFPINAKQLRGFAYDNCTGIAFTAELVATSGNTTIYAVPPPGGGAVGTVQPPQAAQGVFFEPYTRTLIAPFSSGNNHDILAYDVQGTTASPKLMKRSAVRWSPPTDIDPYLVSVATPYPAECE